MIIQNLLPDFLAEQIRTELSYKTFPWFYRDFVLYEDTKELFPQFNHVFYAENEIQSQYYSFVIPILWFFQKETNIKIKSIFRIKTNLNTKYPLSESDIQSLVHTDHEEDKYLSLIYYVDDSDGDTIIYKDNEVIAITPKYNQLCYFKSNIPHVGVFPKENNKRIIINFIVELESN